MRPILLRPDNFTPRERTPWGGTRIARDYKRGIAGIDPARLVGESWEISVEPDFESRVDETGAPLRAVLTPAMLGRETAGTALLVKLLDAADDLSVQIHPADGDPKLGAGESGKPESWYVLAAEAGAGIYFGLRSGVTEPLMASALEHGDDVSQLLGFVPVEPGDFFVIEAGTAHAIGRGVTLVEPQHVAPGKRGLTYRYWDWNRRYAPDGRRDPEGAPRPLHVARALEVTRWDAPREGALLAHARVVAGAPSLNGPVKCTFLAGPGGIESDHLWVARLAGTGSFRLPPRDTLVGLTVVEGSVHVADVVVSRGRSAVLPANLADRELALEGAHAILTSVA